MRCIFLVTEDILMMDLPEIQDAAELPLENGELHHRSRQPVETRVPGRMTFNVLLRGLGLRGQQAGKSRIAGSGRWMKNTKRH